MAVNWLNHTGTASEAQVPTPDLRQPNIDPARDGVVGLYALRILDRGVDPRDLVAEHRSVRYGMGDRVLRQASIATDAPRLTEVGRGAATILAQNPERIAAPSLQAAPIQPAAPVRRPARARRLALPSLPGLASLILGTPAAPGRNPRRLVTAGFAVATMLGIGVMGALAQEQPAQQLYVVQQGDSLETVAATFGVDPDAILAASAVQNPPALTPSEVVVIPSPDQTPEEAAIMAAERAGTSPFVIAAYTLGEGETLGDVASWFQIPVEDLTAFNGITSPELLDAGQRLLIPSIEPESDIASTTEPATVIDSGDLATEPVAPVAEAEHVIEAAQSADLAPEQAIAEDASAWTAPGAMVSGVAPYHQEFNLSPAFASGFIATNAFGAGVPEAVFIDSVPLSPNPHWGYRGNLNGDWGNTTDYGVYAEPLVPVLNANGFNGEVFYGGGDPASLQAFLDAGSPVIAWLGFYGDTAYAVEDDGAYLLAPGMHTVVVYGYDEYGVNVADPASGSLTYYTWDEFLAMWSILDGMGLAVSPW